MGSYGLASSELCGGSEVEGEQSTAEETECSTGTGGQEIMGASRSEGSWAGPIALDPWFLREADLISK